MADLDPKTIETLEQLEKAAEETAKRITEAGDGTGQLTRHLNKLREKIELLSGRSLKDLQDQFEAGKISAADLAKGLGDINARAKTMGVTMSRESQVLSKSLSLAAVKTTMFSSGLAAAGEGLEAWIDLQIANYKALNDSLLRSNNAYDLSTKQQLNQVDFQAKLMTSFKDLAMGLAPLLILLGPEMIPVIAAIEALGMAGGAAVEKWKDLSKFGIENLKAELDKTTKSFGEATSAGVFLANGMTELKNLANDSGMSVKVFTESIKHSSDKLAMIGGNAGEGAKQLAGVYKAMEPYRKGLNNLGISQEDQIAGAADYMELQRRAGTLDFKSKEQLAKETDKYLTSLKVISSITGEEAKAAEKRAREAAEQLYVQAKLRELGGDASLKFQNAIKVVPKEFQSAMAQMMDDAGEVTNIGLRTSLENAPTYYALLKEYRDNIKNGQMSDEEAQKRYRDGLAKNGKQIEMELGRSAYGIGRATNLTGAYAETSKASGAILQEVIRATGKGYTEAADAVDDAKTTQDKLTQSVSETTDQFWLMQAILEKKLIPDLLKFSSDAMNTNSSTFKGLITPQSIDRKSALVSSMMSGGALGLDDAAAIMDAAANNPSKARAGGDPSTSGPVIAGEKGPEAIIPLPDGRTVPTNLDLSPLTKIMHEFVNIAKDQRDIQEKLLNNSY